MTADCLVIGHYDQPVEELAARALPSQGVSGGYCEVRTNSVLADGEHLSYSDLFNRLSLASAGLETAFSPFSAPHAGVLYLVNRLRGAGFDAQGLHYVSASKRELTQALRSAQPRVVAITT